MWVIIQKLLSDFSLLYRKFIHWNISKILIVIFTFLLGILFALPFLIIVVILMNIDPIDWKDIISTFYTSQTIGMSLLTALSSHLFYIIIEALFLILWVLSFWFWSSYRLILLAKLNLDYKKWTPTKFFQNYYFNGAKILKVLGIFSWIWLVFFALFLAVVLFVFVVILLFWWIDNSYLLATQGTSISGFSLIILFWVLSGILAFLYLAYRMNYSYIIMLDEENYPQTQSALSYVKESFKITSGVKIFKFVWVALLFSLCIMLPIDYLAQYLENIDAQVLGFVYGIIIFLCINGLFEMLLVSTYYSIMLPQTEKKEVPLTHISEEIV